MADDEWIGVLRRLTQFGSTPESIGMDVEAVKNLAGIIGSVSSAAELYSKALQGNFEAFSRYGISVSEAGDKTAKLQQLQEQLAQRGGGQLEAMNRTLLGQFRDLKNNVADVVEAFGRGESKTGALQQILYGLSTSLGWLASVLGGTVPQVDGLSNALTRTIAPAGEAEEAIRKFVDANDAIKTSAEAAIKALRDQIEAIKAAQRAADEVTDAEMASALTKVDEREARGTMTPQQATRARGATRIAFENKKRLTANEADRQQISLLDKAAQEQMERRYGAKDQLAEADDNAFAVGRYEGLQQKAGASKAKYKTNLQELIDLKSEQDSLHNGRGTNLIGGDSGTITKEELDARVTGLELYVEKLRKESSSATSSAQKARARLSPGAPASSVEAQAILKAARENETRTDIETEGTLHDLRKDRSALSGGIEQRNKVRGIRDSTETRKAKTDVFKQDEQERRKREADEQRETERQEREIKRHLFDRGGASLEIKEPDSQQVQQAASRVVAALEKNNAVILAAFSRMEMTANVQGGKIATLFSRNVQSRTV